jgi:predicted GIY-YIG superfamily endonuclease
MTIKEQIDIIQKEFSIFELISPYTELKEKGKSLIGVCPICKSKKGFFISPQKNICKCFICGNGGGPINFIMKFENLDFKTALDFIITKFSKTLGPSFISNDLTRGSVYVLKLENNCFYIGFTRNMSRRMKEHFSSNGSIWTKKNKPVSIECEFKDKTLNYENYLTEKGIKKYGYDYVRGGDHLYFAKKYGNTKHNKV